MVGHQASIAESVLLPSLAPNGERIMYISGVVHQEKNLENFWFVQFLTSIICIRCVGFTARVRKREEREENEVDGLGG